MVLWIVTTGNSDIQLETDENWLDLYGKVRYDDPLESCQKFSDICNPDEETELFLAPARVLGLVYGQEEEAYSDLRFPLLEVFTDLFENRSDESIESPDRVLIFLTDQSEIFNNDQREYYECPFWQDTCTLQSLLYRYFQENLGIAPEFITINPESNREKGIDHWDEMLDRVGEKLEEFLREQNIQSNELVYVSHQAGTPAISSAVQFLCVSQFENVQFLVSNKYYDYEEECWQYQPELIQSSKYWRGLQVQKAQTLLKKGLPGAALELVRGLVDSEKLQEVEKWRDRFNIKPTVKDRKSDEFNPENAGKRVREALDLIEIFFEQENYLQGIILLAAAQETFMKAAVIKALKQKIPVIGRVGSKDYNFSPLEVLQWTNQGLLFLNDRAAESNEKKENNKKANQLLQIDYLSYDKNKEFFRDLRTIQIKILQKLNFPVSQGDENLNLWKKLKENKLFNLKCTNSNNALLQWLKNLFPEFESWNLLDWIGGYKREFEDDRRNQLMHNLRGVEPEDVLAYLQGNPDENNNKNEVDCQKIYEFYRQEIKKKFVQALYDCGLCENDDPRNFIKEELQKLADSL